MTGHGQKFGDIERAFFFQQFKLYTRASFDDPNAEFISVKNLGDALRMCGHAPFECEVEEFARQADPEKTGRLNFDTFLDCVFASFTRLHSVDELKDAFRAFDPEMRGIVSITDLRFMLTKFGEKLTDAEMNEFVQEAQSEMDSDGLIMYDGLITKLLPAFLTQ
jgi:Ca2+-binding EF-hand superfamily protein